MLHAAVGALRLCFARVDWRGSAHINRRPGHRLHLEDAGNTHFHDPAELGGETLEVWHASNLAIAYALPQEPKTFPELMEISSKLLNIEGLEKLERPLWTPLGL